MAMKTIEGYIEVHSSGIEVMALVHQLPFWSLETYDGFESFEFYESKSQMDSGELAAKLNEIHEVATRTGVKVTARLRCRPVFTDEVFIINDMGGLTRRN